MNIAHYKAHFNSDCIIVNTTNNSSIPWLDSC